MLLVDNGSVFTDDIEECLDNFLVTRLTPNSVDDDLKRYDSFILSGRKSNNKKTNAVNAAIIRHADSTGKPLFGICYGAEMLALTFGGTIRKMSKVRRGLEKVTFEQNPLCDTGVQQVFESHRYEIANLGSRLERIGGSETCENEFVHVVGTKMFGAQFHPEETYGGQKMLLKFADT
ncbi:MAG: glutamine amidotransferase class I (guaA) [Cenarchaeum symbiont of Oopsacas minuta]|nr:glutamine amidotransferase class I (guaA) [Cenarchaeum symbiont of Oopsacas minuta]